MCLWMLSLLLYSLLLLSLVFYFHLHLLFITSIIYTCQFSLSQSRRQLSFSTHYLEEYKEEVLEPFIGNPTSPLDLSWPFASSFYNCCIFTLTVIRLALHLFTPSRCTFIKYRNKFLKLHSCSNVYGLHQYTFKIIKLVFEIFFS